jgi:hypothetical protein
MPKSEFKDALDRTSEIELTVRGRKSGQDISRPVWFVHENNTLYLLPVQGSETNWYKNVLKARINLSSSKKSYLRRGGSRNWTMDRFT